MAHAQSFLIEFPSFRMIRNRIATYKNTELKISMVNIGRSHFASQNVGELSNVLELNPTTLLGLRKTFQIKSTSIIVHLCDGSTNSPHNNCTSLQLGLGLLRRKGSAAHLQASSSLDLRRVRPPARGAPDKDSVLNALVSRAFLAMCMPPSETL